MRKEVERMSKYSLAGLIVVLAILTTPVMAAEVFIKPSTTAVAPGDVFSVNISIQDGAVRSVLVNFSYDATKITYVNGSTSGLFNFMESITGVPTVRYVGVSTTNVPVVDETRLATVVFRVNPDASGTITFNCITANVDGSEVSCNDSSSVTITPTTPTITPTTPTPTPNTNSEQGTN